MKLQKAMLHYLIKDNDTFYLNKLDKSYFTKLNQKLFSIIEKYYNKYEVIPTFDELVGVIEEKVKKDKSLLIELIEQIKNIKPNLTKEQLFYELKQSKLVRELDNIAPELIDALEEKQLDKVEQIINKIQNKFLDIDDKVTKDIKDVEFKPMALATIECFLDSMNSAGFNLAGLAIVGAATGQGKSIFALNQAIYAYNKGLKVSIMSLELPESQVLLRLYAMTNKENYSDLIKSPKDVLKNKIDKWKNEYFKNGGFFIKHYRYTPTELKKAIINDIKRGVKFFVVDYLNLVEVDSKVEDWRSLSRLAKDLHDIAMQYGVVILSPTQINIEEDKNKKLKVSARGSRELEFSASTMLLIYQNKDEYKEGVARIKVLKSRNSRKFTTIAKTNFGNMLFEDTGVILDDF